MLQFLNATYYRPGTSPTEPGLQGRSNIRPVGSVQDARCHFWFLPFCASSVCAAHPSTVAEKRRWSVPNKASDRPCHLGGKAGGSLEGSITGRAKFFCACGTPRSARQADDPQI